jgi:large subunit ribosomal protein L9
MQTQLILTSNIPGLGAEGDVVSVSGGYARNFLVPRNMAILATAAAMKRVEALKLLRAERERKELEHAQELAKKIAKIQSTVELQTSEEGKLFGSVTSADIAAALAGRGFEIDRKAVQLEEPIRRTGAYEIPIRLHAQVTATFKLTVASLNQPTPTAETAGAKKGKGAREHKGAAKEAHEDKAKPAAAKAKHAAKHEEPEKAEKHAKSEKHSKEKGAHKKA